MHTYLLTWSPLKWPESAFRQILDAFLEYGFVEDHWSCGLNKRIQPGDRVFLLRQSVEPRGMVGSGYATSEVFRQNHWDEILAAQGKQANYINVRFDQLFDADEQIFPRSELGQGELGKMHWDTQMSGVPIPDKIAVALEEEWNRFTREIPISDFEPHAVEGLVTETIRYSHGRSDALRKQALAKANGSCAVCKTDFKKVLNGKGTRVLHVHHLRQMASSDAPRITKLSDLAVVCANCHMLIHSNPTKAIPIEKLRSVLGKI